jgi:hypothetical protein
MFRADVFVTAETIAYLTSAFHNGEKTSNAARGSASSPDAVVGPREGADADYQAHSAHQFQRLQGQKELPR